MDTDSISINYDQLVSDMVRESSELENELPEHIKHDRLSDDSSQTDEYSPQEVINTTEFQSMALDHIMNHDNVTNTESDKPLFEWTNNDMSYKAQSLADNASSKAARANYCAVEAILEIFPFVCGLCDEKFKCISIYLTHISMHEKMTAYWLHCCSEHDTGIGNKITHFTCGNCSIKFPTLCSLYKHLIETESVNDFVFKSNEGIAYAYNEGITESVGAVTKSSQTSRRRKRVSNHLDQDTDVVENSTNVAKVEMMSTKLVADSFQESGDTVDSTDDENVIEKAINLGKKSKSRKRERSSRTCGKKKKKESQRELDVSNVLDSRKKNTKRKDLPRGNAQKRTKRANFSINSSLASKDVKDDIEGDFKIKEDSDDIIEDNVKLKEDVNDQIEESLKVLEDVDDNKIKDVVDMKKDHKTYGVDDDNDNNDGGDETTNKQKRTKQLKKKDHRDQKFPCEICGLLVTLHYLKRHKQTHFDPTLPCDQCDLVFCDKNKLKYHKKHVHTDELKYTCDVCGKSFKAWPYLTQHRKTHNKERKYQCPECPLTFKTAGVRRVHMNTHSDQKPYCCEVCGLSFKRAGFLTTHKKYHSEEKPYSCPDCGKSFKVKQDMKKHYRVHLPPKYFCSICGKSFVQKYNMRIHMKVHGMSIKTTTD